MNLYITWVIISFVALTGMALSAELGYLWKDYTVCKSDLAAWNSKLPPNDLGSD